MSTWKKLRTGLPMLMALVLCLSFALVPATPALSADNTINLVAAVSNPAIDNPGLPGVITPPITVTDPNTDVYWARGSTRTIKWNYAGSAGSTVKIELMKGTAVNKVIATAAPIGTGGHGSRNWKVPGTQTLGGNYKIRLTTNTGKKDSSNAYFHIIATQDIQVELTWNTSGTDVDSHFLKPGVGATTGRNTVNDCYYSNKTPDWGTYGNPVLDRDDQDGYGPEVITLTNPANTGTKSYYYQVYFWSDHGYTTPATNVTVKVWINGVLKKTFTHNNLTNNQWWKVCKIKWASGTGTITYVNTLGSPLPGAVMEDKPK